MTAKQQRFIAEYLIDLNATQAAIRAGFSAKTAASAGYRLLMNVQIAQAIADGKAAQLESAGLSAARVLEEWRRIAFTDARAFWDDQGNLKPFSELTVEQGAALAGFEAVIKNAQAGDGITDTIHKIKLWDKVRVLESLGKHFGLLTERLEHTGDFIVRWQTPSEKS